MNLDDYPTPETDYRKYKAFPPSGALGIGFDVVDTEMARDLERRLAACRDALSQIDTLDCKDGPGGCWQAEVAHKTLELTKP
jgi:hypothetical protein